jgi:hypothetical protein
MRAVLVVVAIVPTIGFNILSAIGLINGLTPGAISAKYPTVLTPANYAFSVWSLIYLGLLAFGIYQLLPSNIERFRNIRTLFIASCLLNVGWVYFWHREMIGICVVIIFALAVVLLLLNLRLKTPDSLRESILTKAPLGLYFGWVTCAALINLMVWLTHSGAGLTDRSETAIGAAFIILAAAIALIVRMAAQNFIFPLAVAWATAAIAVKQGANTPIIVAAAFGTVASLVIAGSIVTQLKDSTSEQR